MIDRAGAIGRLFLHGTFLSFALAGLCFRQGLAQVVEPKGSQSGWKRAKSQSKPAELKLVQQTQPDPIQDPADPAADEADPLPDTIVIAPARPGLNVPGGPAVIGSSQAVQSLPGSGTFLDGSDIGTYDDINRVLRQVPGVYVRPEDGYGLFPNISLRGVDTSRSAKLTIMEDGVLTAPAPYSAPAAYYSPTAGRMFAIEVLKGSSQVRFGPHITGGVINYLSTPIPEAPMLYTRMLYGQFNEIRNHTYAGGTYETKHGRVGVLLEGYFRETDGFKSIDLTPDFRLTVPAETFVGSYTATVTIAISVGP